MKNTEELLKRLGVDIDAGTLRLALTHRSYAYEHGGIPTNERLEVLGDSILGFSVTDALYRDNPDLSEGELAKRRSAVVSTKALASVARQLQLSFSPWPSRMNSPSEMSIGAFKIRFLSGDQDPSGVDAMRLVSAPKMLADRDRSRETSHHAYDL